MSRDILSPLCGVPDSLTLRAQLTISATTTNSKVKNVVNGWTPPLTIPY
jgi:hypothetical protein